MNRYETVCTRRGSVTLRVGERKGEERRFLAGASSDLSITVRRKPAVGSGIPVASLLRVLWLSLCGPPQKCQPLSLTHTHMNTHSCWASHSLNIVFLASAALKTTFNVHFLLRGKSYRFILGVLVFLVLGSRYTAPFCSFCCRGGEEEPLK